jgi:anti-sigma regulatory factor (Ser/Thr protein kinase)
VTAVREIAVDLPPSADSVGTARARLESLRGTVKDDLFEDLRLLVSEVVTNSVRHAGLGPHDAVELHVTAEPDHVRAEILDAGPGFRPPQTGPVAGAGSGWGLYLVGRVADRWGVDRADGRTRVWFELDC